MTKSQEQAIFQFASDTPEKPKLEGQSLAAGIVIVAGVYVVLAWLGLLLAVPPGYATVIWPASGVATAVIIQYGMRLAPGILIGSFCINAYTSNVIGADGVDLLSLGIALGIAIGSTLQAVLAGIAVRKLFGAPLRMSKLAHIGVFAVLVGPVACLVAATIGVGVLYFAGVMQPTAIADNWITWWLGDIIGVIVFLPLCLAAPWRPWSFKWRGRPAAGLTLLSLVVLLVPLGLTFYAWKATSEATFARSQLAFVNLAEDNERALQHRLDSYLQSLDGGAGLIEASERVSLPEWRTYVEAIDISKTLPGINGIGVIVPVPDGQMDQFLSEARLDGITDLKVHPDVPAPANFVIRYIEPKAQNIQAIGLNIAFEDNRYQAAVRARDTGLPSITKRIFLVQDATKSAGFLLLRPLYKHGEPVSTVAERRAAFKEWVYAPFIGNSFMAGLTASQGSKLNLHVYDGVSADPDQLIYSSGEWENKAPTYKIKKTIELMGQSWTLVWDSTPAFDTGTQTGEASLVFAGGAGLTLFLGAYLLSFARREEEIRRTVERKTHEIAAKERENRAVVETAVAGIVLLDENGCVLSMNDAAEKIFKCGKDTALGKPLKSLLGEKSRMSWKKLHARLTAMPTSSDNQPVTAYRPDGSELVLDLQLNSWKTGDDLDRYTVVMRDISVQQRIKIELEQAEARWSTALRGAHIGVFDVNLRTGKSVVSNTWLEMLGFSQDEKIEPQAEWEARVHPDDRILVAEAERACIDGETSRAISEYRLRHRTKGWIWLRSDASVTERDANGVAIRLVGTQTDITELKAAEAALETSQARLRSAIDNAPIGMALISPEGRWIRVNDAICEFLGYSPEELLGAEVYDVVYEEDKDRSHELIAQLTSGKVKTIQQERRYIHKKGHTVWGLLSASLERNEDGTPAYYISQIMDINDRKEVDRMKSEFISNVSHELRTPLTSIRGSLGLISGTMSAGIPDGVMKLLTIAHKNSERLILLINDLLDLEKMSADKIQFDIQREDIFQEVINAVEVNQAYANQFGVAFEFVMPVTKIYARIDKSRFQQVLSNLMSNAAKFSPRNGVVEIGITEMDSKARVWVRDHGPGIPVNFRGNIFQPFSQADASATREQGGTGLGLHIAQGMMERMGGRIDYESTLGEGTTFWADVPIDADEELPVKSDEKSDLPVALHVEDDPDFASFLATALRDKITLKNAPTLATARAALSDAYNEMIIIDVELPDGNGLDLLKDLDKDWRKPVIVLTASDVTNPDPERIHKVIVKSRTPEKEIIRLIAEAADEMSKRKPEMKIAN